MNTSDDEEIKEITDQRSEEIETLLEPQAIPNERIVRHVDRNDSYREAPTLDNDEEIVQPPLDPSDELEIQVDLPKEDRLQINEDVSVIQKAGLDDVPVIVEEMTPPPRMSQHDIEPEGVFYEDAITEQVTVLPEVIPQTTKEVDVEQGMEATQASPQVAPVTSAQPVVYHTVSGGPETLNDTRSLHHKVEPVIGQPTEVYANTATGYTIPNPNYVPPVALVAAPQSYVGTILLFGFIFIIGGTIGYLYFFMPETFNQFFSATVIVKDQILKK